MSPVVTTPPVGEFVVPLSPRVPKGSGQIRGIDDRFESLDLLASNNSTEIYVCHDRQLGHRVVLKRLHPNRSNRQYDWLRFMCEPEVMRQLPHETSIAVHDVFPEKMYKPYFTMDMVEGNDLCLILRGLRHGVASMHERFPLSELLQVVLEVADGLADAHRIGWVHRDIKPENLMITPEGDTKILDWGIAWDLRVDHRPEQRDHASHRRQSQSQQNVRLTRSDQRPGTPLYMSREQIQTPSDIDARTDVFSLGCVLYDCLALTTLIQGHTRNQVFHYTTMGMYRRPSECGFRRLMPQTVEDVCMQAVACDRNDRFESMQSFINALNDAIEIDFAGGDQFEVNDALVAQ